MADATYQPKVYRKHGAEELVVASGGTLTVESGGTITLTGATVNQAAASVTAASLGANLKTGFIPLPLGGFRLIASNDIPAIAVASGNGGNLGNDTAPALARINGATDKGLRIVWIASGVVEITSQIVYPPDLDDTAVVAVNLLAKMAAGGMDTPVIGVGYFEGVGDTDAGGNTAALSTTLAQVTVTIAAADVGAYPKAASIILTPAAHANEALELYGAWITYTRKT